MHRFGIIWATRWISRRTKNYNRPPSILSIHVPYRYTSKVEVQVRGALPHDQVTGTGWKVTVGGRGEPNFVPFQDWTLDYKQSGNWCEGG